MLRFPNCKINIGLYITSRRSDGYHNLETIFYPVAVQDALEVVPAKESEIHINGLTVAGSKEDNLVWEAYKILKELYPEKVKPIDMYLLKAIPMGAGLGGGSADGAFMLQLLNDYFHLALNDEQLAHLALQLGSDCPFFIYNTPQYATGRGEVMQPVSIDLSGYSIQLICPEVHISTKAAFGMITPRPASFDLHTIAQLPIQEWKNHIKNDFEMPVFEQHPFLGDVKNELYQQGAIYASMSGSGSTVYGIFPKSKKATIQVDVACKTFYIE